MKTGFLLKVLGLMMASYAICAPLHAEPVLHATYPDKDAYMDALVTIEAKLRWPVSDGSYKFLQPEWKINNLKFVNESRAEESIVSPEGEAWSQVTIHYDFKPEQVGKASIGFLRLDYVNLQTQRTGSISIVRQLDLIVHKSHGASFQFLILILGGLLLAGVGFAAWYCKFSANCLRDQQERKEKNEYETATTAIENAHGSQKEMAFDWGKQLKTFLVHRYELPRTIMTEQEALEALQAHPSISKTDVQMVASLFERISQAKFSPKDLPEESFTRLKNELTSFVRGKKIA